ncbi:unnamed protein product, partial [Scytosiphon promiscuus]
GREGGRSLPPTECLVKEKILRQRVEDSRERKRDVEIEACLYTLCVAILSAQFKNGNIAGRPRTPDKGTKPSARADCTCVQATVAGRLHVSWCAICEITRVLA